MAVGKLVETERPKSPENEEDIRQLEEEKEQQIIDYIDRMNKT